VVVLHEKRTVGFQGEADWEEFRGERSHKRGLLPVGPLKKKKKKKYGQLQLSKGEGKSVAAEATCSLRKRRDDGEEFGRTRWETEERSLFIKLQGKRRNMSCPGKKKKTTNEVKKL